MEIKENKRLKLEILARTQTKRELKTVELTKNGLVLIYTKRELDKPFIGVVKDVVEDGARISGYILRDYDIDYILL